MRTIRRRRKVREISRKVIENPAKGLNNFVSPTLVKDTEASDLKNIMFTESGVVQKRPGIQKVGTGLSTDARGLGVFNTTSANYLLTVDGTALKYLNGSTWTSISGATLNADAEINFTQARGDMYIFDGVSGMCKLTSGLTLTRPTTTVSASFGIFYSSYHFVSGVGTQASRVYMSNLDDASDFTDTGDDATSHPGSSAWAGTDETYYIDIEKDDGDEVTGFAKFSDVLVIFKRRSIHQLTLDSSGVPTVSRVATGIGSLNHKSIENVENDVFFMSDDGYYVLGNEQNYFDLIRTNELSARVKPTIQTMDKSGSEKIAAIYHNNLFLSSFPVGGTTNNTTLMYDRRYLAWSKWTNVNANSYAVYQDSDNEEHLYFAADDEAEVYEIEFGTYNDEGAAIDAYWVSKAFDLKNFDVSKRWVDVTVLLRKLSGQLTLSVYTDGDELAYTHQISTTSTAGMGIDMLGEEGLGETGGTVDDTAVVNVPYRIRVNKNSRTIKLKIANNRTNENFFLLAFSLGYYPFSHYKFDSAYKLQG